MSYVNILKSVFFDCKLCTILCYCSITAQPIKNISPCFRNKEKQPCFKTDDNAFLTLLNRLQNSLIMSWKHDNERPQLSVQSHYSTCNIAAQNCNTKQFQPQTRKACKNQTLENCSDLFVVCTTLMFSHTSLFYEEKLVNILCLNWVEQASRGKKTD